MGFFSTKAVALSGFEQFSVHSDFPDEAIIGRPLFSLFGKSRFKAISSLSLQRYSGETASVVNDFKKSLSEKYGAEIANFVFSHQYEQAALLQGLTKKTIQAVLKKAAVLKKTDVLSYRQLLQTKDKVAIKVVEKLKGKSCYEEALKKYQVIQAQLQEFDETLTYFEPDLTSGKVLLEKLQRDFQEKLTHVDGLTRSIMALSEAEEKIKKIFGSSERSQEMLKIFLQHQGVMEELKQEFSGTWRPSTAGTAMVEISKNLDPLVRTIEKAATLLSSFSIHFSEENNLNYFSLN